MERESEAGRGSGLIAEGQLALRTPSWASGTSAPLLGHDAPVFYLQRPPAQVQNEESQVSSFVFIPSEDNPGLGCPFSRVGNNFWHNHSNNGPTEQVLVLKASSQATRLTLPTPGGSGQTELHVNGALEVSHTTEALNVGEHSFSAMVANACDDAQPPEMQTYFP